MRKGKRKIQKKWVSLKTSVVSLVKKTRIDFFSSIGQKNLRENQEIFMTRICFTLFITKLGKIF